MKELKDDNKRERIVHTSYRTTYDIYVKMTNEGALKAIVIIVVTSFS